MVHVETIEHRRNNLVEDTITNIFYSVVSGHLAAGKSTFLETIVRDLNLNYIGVEVFKAEPEEIPHEYTDEMDELRMRLRKFTRGNQATLGYEFTQIFCDLPQLGIVRINLQGGGGHLEAQDPYQRQYMSQAYFYDQKLLEITKHFVRSTDLSYFISKYEKIGPEIKPDLADTKFKELLNKIPQNEIDQARVEAVIEEFYGPLRRKRYKQIEELSSDLNMHLEEEIHIPGVGNEELVSLIKSFTYKMWYFQSHEQQDVASLFVTTKKIDLNHINVQEDQQSFQEIIDFAHSLYGLDQELFYGERYLMKLPQEPVSLQQPLIIQDDAPYYTGTIEACYHLIETGLRNQGYNTQGLRLIVFDSDVETDYLIGSDHVFDSLQHVR